jgi:hypothetical protein
LSHSASPILYFFRIGSLELLPLVGFEP